MPVCQQNSGIHTVRGVLCLQERFLVDNYAFDASIQLHSRAGMRDALLPDGFLCSRRDDTFTDFDLRKQEKEGKTKCILSSGSC